MSLPTPYYQEPGITIYNAELNKGEDENEKNNC